MPAMDLFGDSSESGTSSCPSKTVSESLPLSGSGEEGSEEEEEEEEEDEEDSYGS